MTTAQHIVILVHGIRTFGAWQDRLAALLHAHEPGVEVHVYKYGYLDALAFLIPGLRSTVIRRFRRYLTEHVARSRDARVDIVAHSFGTYVVAWALRRLPAAKRPSIHTVILCGSVLKQLFPWGDLVGSGLAIRRLVNECGTGDRWPVVAQLFVFGMGVSGRRGFAGVTGIDVGIVNRHFPVDHGGFFTDAFMNEHWIPLLTRSDPPLETHSVPPTPGWAAGLEYYADPAKLAFLLLPLLLLALWYQAQRANVAIAKENAARAEANAAMANESAARSDAKLAIEAAERAIANEEAAQSKADTAIANEKTAQAQLATQTAEEKARRAALARAVEAERRAEEQVLKLVAEANLLIYRRPDQAMLIANRAIEESPNEKSRQVAMVTRQTSLQIMGLRERIRHREEMQWDTGVAWIAPMWFTGKLSANQSRDGRYVLVTTGRGEDERGPGDVYLLDNQTLKLVNLQAPFHKQEKRRLEYAGFSTSDRRIYVARQFTIEVYSKDGTFLRAFRDGGHGTKYPITVVDSVRNDEWVVYGDTDGSIVTFPFDFDRNAVRTLGRVSQNPVVKFQLSHSGRTLLLIRKKGHAYVWTVGNNKWNSTTLVPQPGVIGGAFQPTHKREMFVATSADGTVGVWEASIVAPEQIKKLEHGRRPVGYVAFTDDGGRFVTVGADRSSRIWDAESLRLITSIPAPQFDRSREGDGVAYLPQSAPPPSRLEPGEAVPLEEMDSIQDVVQTHDHTYLLTAGEMFSTASRAYHVQSDVAVRLRSDVLEIVLGEHQVWLRTGSRSFMGLSGGNGPAYRLTPDALTPFPASEQKVSQVELHDGKAWLRTLTGAFVLDGEELSRFGGPDLRVNWMARTGELLWLFTDQGVYRVDRGGTVRATDQDLPAMGITQVGDAWWITTNASPGKPSEAGAAYRLQGQALQAFPDEDTRVYVLKAVGAQVWLGTDRGAYAVSGDRVSRLVKCGGRIADITQAGGAIWLFNKPADGAGQVCRVRGNQIKAFAVPGHDIHSVFEAGGHVWVTTKDAGSKPGPVLVLKNSGEEVLFRVDTGVNDVLEFGHTTWVATPLGLYHLAGQHLERIEGIEGSTRKLTAFDGKLWVATDAGVYRRDGKTFSEFAPDRYVTELRPMSIEGRRYVFLKSGSSGRLVLLPVDTAQTSN